MKVIKMRKIIKRLFISAITFILLIFAIFISIIDIEEAIEPPKGAVRIGDLKDIYGSPVKPCVYPKIIDSL